MTEAEYARGNKIATTYLLQAACVVLMASAIYLGFRAVINGRHLGIQPMLFSANAGMFLFQVHIRRTLRR